ncbi:hypothetical protein TCAL_08532 [Tigriopus californicus]|uniref:Beta-lactamase-related domain-containing protein n=1 Tax=Tigriopus californicus TaxID=6832 RepID=A0A553PBU2_TIGCA|nr:beta-lactamase domain-containing protein 2-like [Tigriopus californicus]TRY75151.1 hypothetical protein TCAL_08532 [Tigriopus californicus]|eukprot:TCALIF_08532-PA protein Name:"Similar to lact-2 Beta-lactamase domain-containing protein 2 (Caenorhabditis elegans)" AED:0.01 eAED:0.01 QI:615/1/1/1/0.5/0.33/3/91/446
MSTNVQGEVDPRFRRVQEVFQRHFENGSERSAQCCVYYQGVKVVDLYGSATDDHSYTANTLQTVFSSTKVVTSIALACMVDQGRLSYKDKIAQHWPEFGQNGKENIRVEDVCRHEAGLNHFSTTLPGSAVLTENIKRNQIGEVIENEWLKADPDEEGKYPRKYHLLTRGWILNEIFRRVEPQGRTMGEYVRQEIAEKLGIDVYIGITDEEMKRLRPLSYLTKGQILLASLNPFTRVIEPSFGGLLAMFQYKPPKAEGAKPKEPHRKPRPALEYMTRLLDPIEVIEDCLSQPVVIHGETPSANGSCSARGMAKLAACIVNGGQLEGVRILSQEACDQMHANFQERPDWSLFGTRTSFSQGGLHLYQTDENAPSLSKWVKNPLRNGYIGWHGLGGSALQWHPKYQVGFAYAPTLIAWEDPGNAKAARLQRAVIDSILEIEGAKNIAKL